MRSRSDHARFGIIVYESVESIDVGATHGVLSMARRLLPALDVVIVAERAGPVQLASGLEIIAHHGFDSCPPLDVAILCGGAASFRQSEDERMLDFVRRAAAQGEIVASVCSSAVILAAAGLLAGRAATTRRIAIAGEPSSPLERLAAAHQDVRWVPAALVDAGAVVTGGAVTLAIDTTLYLIGRIYGERAAADVAAILEYGPALAANRAALGVLSASPGG